MNDIESNSDHNLQQMDASLNSNSTFYETMVDSNRQMETDNEYKVEPRKNNWIPSTYSYKEEVMKILTNELHLGDSIVRAVMKL